MGWLAASIVTGITSFTATNIDDLVILMLFFTQVNANFRPRQIVVGQYLGFSVLILASLPGFFGGLIIPEPWMGLLGLVPIAIGCKHLLHRNREEPEIQTVSEELNAQVNASPFSKLAKLFNPQTFNVAAVTCANGGDNIGIYLPLFASSNLPELVVILIVFFTMVAVWCAVAYWFTRHAAIARAFTHSTHVLVPFVLISLGLYILIDNGSYQLLPLFPGK